MVIRHYANLAIFGILIKIMDKISMSNFRKHIVFLALAALILPAITLADEDTSAHFKVLDPVIYSGWGAAESTSLNFKLWDVIGQVGIGLGDSAHYGLKAGFLYYPAPTVAAEEEEEEAVSGGEGVIMTLLRQFVPYEAPLPPLEILPCAPATDLNCDGQVNLKDLSIFLYAEPQPVPSLVDFNKDKKVDTRDLSILFYNWTERLLAFAPEKASVSMGPAKEAQPRFAPAKSAVVSEIMTPEKGVGVEAPKPNIFEKVIQFVGKVCGKIADFFRAKF